MAIQLTQMWGVCLKCRLRFPIETEKCSKCDDPLKRKNVTLDEWRWPTVEERKRETTFKSNEKVVRVELKRVGLQERLFFGLSQNFSKSEKRQLESLGGSLSSGWNARWRGFVILFGEDRKDFENLLEKLLDLDKKLESQTDVWRRILQYECHGVFDEGFDSDERELVLFTLLELQKSDTSDGLLPLVGLRALYKSRYGEFKRQVRDALSKVASERAYKIGYDASGEVGYWSNYNKFGSR